MYPLSMQSNRAPLHVLHMHSIGKGGHSLYILASKEIKLSKMMGNSASYSFNSLCIDSLWMAIEPWLIACKHLFAFLRYNTSKSIILTNYNCASKVALHKSSHIYIVTFYCRTIKISCLVIVRYLLQQNTGILYSVHTVQYLCTCTRACTVNTIVYCSLWKFKLNCQM